MLDEICRCMCYQWGHKPCGGNHSSDRATTTVVITPEDYPLPVCQKCADTRRERRHR